MGKDGIKTKKCENECPKCGAKGDKINWLEKAYLEGDDNNIGEIKQLGICKVCGTNFGEYYKYYETEWTEETET